MKKPLLILPVILALHSCTTTFGGSVFVFTFGDLVLYVMLALVLAFITSVISENRQRSFWLTFLLGILLTPLVSLIFLLVLVTRRRKKRDLRK